MFLLFEGIQELPISQTVKGQVKPITKILVNSFKI